MNLFSLALAGFLAASSPIKEPAVNFRPSQPASEEVLRGEIVYSQHIEEELRRFTTDDLRVITMDSTFGCLPEKEVRALVANLLVTFDNTYIDDIRDCDDLALEFIVEYRRRARGAVENIPLAVPAGLVDVKLCQDIPEMGYKVGGGIGYHAIVIIRCMGGKYLLVDPDTKKVSEFTQYLYEGAIELRRVIF